MEKKLSLQKETIHRLGGSSIQEREDAQGANNQGMNVHTSFHSTISLTTVLF